MGQTDKQLQVGILGSGTMGSGIAQVAATHGAHVLLFDVDSAARERAKESLQAIMVKLTAKGKLTQDEADAILARIDFVESLEALKDTNLVIEAVVEDLEVKQKCFRELESIVDERCVLATNTSSLSVTAIAASCNRAERVLGTHFFNPVPLMALVEVIPGVQTDSVHVESTREILSSWNKVTVAVKDTPGFLINRVARPFYGEALRIFDEGIADVATIDWAMKELGGFRMGPFEVMDLIGNDVNYKVTESVFTSFFFDPRFKPSFTQKRLVEAGHLGRKSGRGFYDYGEGVSKQKPSEDRALGEEVFLRILCMLINEAADAVFFNIATVEDVDIAMVKGVNYPKGLLKWADELGLERVLEQLSTLETLYGEDRYRPNPLLKRLVREGKTFY